VIPGLIRLVLPKEIKEMLDRLKGSRTLILLVIANLPDAAASLARVFSGLGNENLATDLVKVVTGFVSILTVAVRLIPEDKK
jgi:hypothetical protein